MTATHECEQCGTKTTHEVGQVELDGVTYDAIRCVVCGMVLLVDIT